MYMDLSFMQKKCCLFKMLSKCTKIKTLIKLVFQDSFVIYKHTSDVLFLVHKTYYRFCNLFGLISTNRTTNITNY